MVGLMASTRLREQRLQCAPGQRRRCKSSPIESSHADARLAWAPGLEPESPGRAPPGGRGLGRGPSRGRLRPGCERGHAKGRRSDWRCCTRSPWRTTTSASSWAPTASTPWRVSELSEFQGEGAGLGGGLGGGGAGRGSRPTPSQRDGTPGGRGLGRGRAVGCPRSGSG